MRNAPLTVILVSRLTLVRPFLLLLMAGFAVTFQPVRSCLSRISLSTISALPMRGVLGLISRVTSSLLELLGAQAVNARSRIKSVFFMVLEARGFGFLDGGIEQLPAPAPIKQLV